MRKNVSKRLCAFVMSFALFGSVFATDIKSEAKVVLNSQLVSEDETKIEEESLVQASYSTISSDEAYDKMVAMEAKYPTGTPWTNDNTYKWNCGWSAAGCMGFAHMISDAAFGNADFRTIYASDVSNIYDLIRVGDVVRVPSGHSVIVLEKHSDHIVVCEGNITGLGGGGKVRWGREISKDTILSQCTYIETRYAADVVTMSVGAREVTLEAGETYKLEAVVVPVNTSSTITWTSSNSSIATVSNDGTITAKGYGTAVVTGTCTETGISASCKVTSLGGINSIFDADYYLDKYPDLQKAFIKYSGPWEYYDEEQVLNHFVNYGMKEGRQASANFNVQAYKNRYVDLQKAYGSDLKKYYIHYMNYGQKEGRIATADGTSQTPSEPVTPEKPTTPEEPTAPEEPTIPEEPVIPTYETVYNGKDYSAVYDYEYYINKYADLKKAFGSDDKAALKHFVNYGMKEGRQAKETFDVKSYKNRYKDLRNAYGSNLKSYYLHYVNYGQKEGRMTTGIVDIQDPTTIYNGVDYSAVYDYKYYINKYADLKKAFEGDDEAALKHFVNYGMKEGRQAKETFNVTYYKNRYADLQKAFGGDLKSYYMHYIGYGKAEGRKTVN